MKKIRLQAHRGVSSGYPENTFAAFKAAIDEGYDIIELDPKFTADNRPVILHDRTLNRTGRTASGTALAPETGIASVTLDEVRAYDFGIWKSDAFRGEKIPTLEEVIGFIGSHGISFKFDNVWETFPEEQRELFLSMLEKVELGSKLGFTCRVESRFAAIASRFPDAELHWDGDNDEETLSRVAAVAHRHRLTVWACCDNDRAKWYRGERASAALGERIHKYGELGIWILSDEADLDDAINLCHADTIETTGHIKPAMVIAHTAAERT